MTCRAKIKMEQDRLKYSIVIFAHNVEKTIDSCIKSILHTTKDTDSTLYVMANGCTDSTENIVEQLQKEFNNIQLVSISIADKANAWNDYLYNFAPKSSLHFFIDGDITVEQNAISSIIETMSQNPAANAVGGVPVVGRDRTGWINRMILLGRISGGLYALQDSFLCNLRNKGLKLPIRLIGEDFLVSALAKNLLNFEGLFTPSPLLMLDRNAGFSFQQLSPLRFKDYFLYFKRLVRYRIRDYQLSMLMDYVGNHNQEMPISVDQLYKETHLLPQYYWRGKLTLIDVIAVFSIRKRVRK